MVGVTNHMSKLACITYIFRPEDIIEDYIEKVYIDGPCDLLKRRSIDKLLVDHLL